MGVVAKKISDRVKTHYFALQGGLDLVAPPITLPEGRFIDGLNYEPRYNGGYRRIDGIERVDGRPRPSDASYWVLNFDGGSAAISEGDIVDGAASGASGEALIDAVVTAGTYGGADAEGYLVLTNVTGNPYQNNESLEVAAAGKSLANGVEVEQGATTDANHNTWLQDAIETTRADILIVPGSGPVRGIQSYSGDVYAVRDNAGATAGVLHKATTAGWAAQALGNRISFTAGTAAFLETETLTGGVSGATATINRVVVQSGTWGGTDAAGYLVIGTVSAGPFQAEAGTSASGAATLSGAEVANTLPAGGRYEFRNYNFYGNTGGHRMYGVNGVGPGFEWDGTIFAPIIALAGGTPDTPEHLEVHKKHLFHSLPNGILRNSGTGLPLSLLAADGAVEQGIGDNITGLLSQTGGTLGVFGRDKTIILYGSASVGDDQWNPVDLSEEAGAIAWSLQSMGRSRYLDDRGLMQLNAVQDFGDFLGATLSEDIDPLIQEKKLLTTASQIVRQKNQYRLFFSDGYGITATFSKANRLVGFGQFLYEDASGTAIVANCTSNGPDSAGQDRIYIGATNGFVYELDAGTSIDGDPVLAYGFIGYTHLKSPTYNKQFLKVILELEAPGAINIQYRPEYDYGDNQVPVAITDIRSIAAAGGTWDVSTWGSFVWSAEQTAFMEGGIDGLSRYVAMRILSESTYDPPHTLLGLLYHYAPRGLVR